MRKVSKIIIMLCLIILGIVSLFFLNKKEVIYKEETKLERKFLTLMIEKEIGTGNYEESSSFPNEDGHYFNKNLSKCENGSKIKYNEKDKTIDVYATEADKCYVYFTFDEKIIAKDLSGNNYYGILKNGALISTDEEGKKGIFFDGIDDYVDIVDLPESINFADGFTIEFEAKWENFNYWSRIIDISRGRCVDGILIASYGNGNSIRTDIRNNNVTYVGNVISNILELNKIVHIKLEVKKSDNNFIQNTYINNVLKDTKTYNTSEIVRNIERNENYLGKSCFEVDKYFNGYIYSLKISDSKNKTILWYDFSD